MIVPRIIHRIWLGERPRPAVYDHYWDVWQIFHPEWELRTWTDKEIANGDLEIINREMWDDIGREFVHTAAEMNQDRAKAVMRADMLSYELLYRFGGIYTNCDVIPLRSLEPLVNAVEEHDACEGFAAYEEDEGAMNQVLSNAIMCATPQARFFKTMVDMVPGRWAVNRQMEVATGAWAMNAGYQLVPTLTRLPRETFFYWHYFWAPRGRMLTQEQLDEARAHGSYAAHMWGTCSSQEGDITC